MKNSLAIINGDYIEKKMREAEGNNTPVHIVSKLDKNIPDEAKIALYKISSDFSIIDDNEKADRIADVMERYGFKEIGTGTNRIAFMKDGYVYKVALDERGFIDNISEYKRSIEFPQYFVKVYETNRTILVCEYCELLSEETFNNRKSEIKSILEHLSHYYVMDDVGLTTKNYCNWGLRHVIDDDGERDDLIIIDNAYFYPIRDNTRMLTCSCGGQIILNTNFTGYVCSNPSCRMTYTVEEILNKSGYDYDAGDAEVVTVVDEKGKQTDSHLKVTGNDAGGITEIKNEEAERIMSGYKNATEADSMPNSLSVLEYFNITEDGPEDDNKYRALGIDKLKR